MDADRILVDSMLSETRDMDAAKRYDARARTVVGHPPEDVAMGGHSAYPRTVREMPGSDVHHRTSRSMNNRTEQDHRGNYPLCGFGAFDVAARLCPAHDELRNHRRSRRHMSEIVSLAEQRRLFQDRRGERCALMRATWAPADES